MAVATDLHRTGAISIPLWMEQELAGLRLDLSSYRLLGELYFQQCTLQHRGSPEGMESWLDVGCWHGCNWVKAKSPSDEARRQKLHLIQLWKLTVSRNVWCNFLPRASLILVHLYVVALLNCIWERLGFWSADPSPSVSLVTQLQLLRFYLCASPFFIPPQSP